MTKEKHGKPASVDAKGRPAAGLDRDIQMKIGEGPRAMYNDG